MNALLRPLPAADAVLARPFLIVQTGHARPEIRPRLGDFPEWFRHSMRLPRGGTVVVDAKGDPPLPALDGFAGVIVTGSGAMVTAREPWSERTAGWLREAVSAGVPLLGVCYGHQLLAHALGGTVADHPSGREIGTVEIERLPAAADDALLGQAPPRFLAHATHVQSVLELPDGAAALARSAHEDHQAVRFGPRAWGFQFHPEFSVEAMQAYIRHTTGNGLECEADCCEPRRTAPAPHARRLLVRFRDLALAAG